MFKKNNIQLLLLTATTSCFSMESSNKIESLYEKKKCILSQLQQEDIFRNKKMKELCAIEKQIQKQEAIYMQEIMSTLTIDHIKTGMRYDNDVITIKSENYIVTQTSGEDNHCFFRALTHDKIVTDTFGTVIPHDLLDIFFKQGQHLENFAWEILRELLMGTVRENLDKTFELSHKDSGNMRTLTVRDYIFRYCQLENKTLDDKRNLGENLFVQKYLEFYEKPKTEFSTEFSVIIPAVFSDFPLINIYDIALGKDGSLTGTRHERVGSIIKDGHVDSIDIVFDYQQEHFYALKEIQ